MSWIVEDNAFDDPASESDDVFGDSVEDMDDESDNVFDDSPVDRTPRTPGSNRFDVNKIANLARNRDRAQAIVLFDATVRFADKFSISDIARLHGVDLHELAVRLFHTTLRFLEAVFQIYPIQNLVEMDYRHEATILFRYTLPYATKFSISDIEELADLRLSQEAIALFDKTVHIVEREISNGGMDLKVVHNYCDKLLRAGLRDQSNRLISIAYAYRRGVP
jgi:hypothetical protein